MEIFQAFNKYCCEILFSIFSKNFLVSSESSVILNTEILSKRHFFIELEEEFDREQQNLLNTARRMSEIRGRKITDRMARAIEAFESGDAHRANIILEEAERDADQALADIHQAKIIGILSIDELLLKTSTIMSDSTIPIEERIKQTCQLYQKAVMLAIEVGYNKKKYASLLERYGCFLYHYAKNDEAFEVFSELIKIRETTLGTDHPDTASSYNYIGNVYMNKGDHDHALEYYMKALEIREKTLGSDHPYIAQSYNNIGNVYSDIGDYNHALDYCMKAFEIMKKILGTNHPNTASSYNNIGIVYSRKGDYDFALKNFIKALEIKEKNLGTYHRATVSSYNNIAWTYHLLGKYEEALPWVEKAISTFPMDSNFIDTLAMVYQGLGRYEEAMEQFALCLKLKKDQGKSDDSIRETEEKLEVLKKLMQ